MPSNPSTTVRDLPTLSPAATVTVIAAAKGGTSVEMAARLAAAAPAAQHPGVERWPVKTGTDVDIGEVGTNIVNGKNLGPGIVDTTIEDMRQFTRPTNMPPVTSQFALNSYYQDRRAAPTETTIWRVTATIVEAKLEQDGDYHLVLKGKSGQTIIAEIPDPDPAYVKNASWLAQIKTARAAMDARLGAPLKALDFDPAGMGPPTEAKAKAAKPAPGKETAAAMTAVNAQAVITGVGFFDSNHGQTGVAQATAIEIHPILVLEFQ
jgi:hypothetical protein